MGLFKSFKKLLTERRQRKSFNQKLNEYEASAALADDEGRPWDKGHKRRYRGGVSNREVLALARAEGLIPYPDPLEVPRIHIISKGRFQSMGTQRQRQNAIRSRTRISLEELRSLLINR
jgi:hypothetical protein